MTNAQAVSRRRFLAGSLAAGASALAVAAGRNRAADDQKALIAITLDMEMSRNFPAWEITHWDYEKGNLNKESKDYTVEACRRVKAAGGVLHCFAVGRVLEQENIDWLKEIARTGHPIGNHTYDHVNVTATKPDDVQFRFKRAPWLIEGKTPNQIIAENIRLCGVALKSRADITADGFRTPGGFANGLADRPDLQKLLLDQGFTWVSSVYPPHKNETSGKKPAKAVYDSIIAAQVKAQPFVYPSGLIEVPMSPISDIGAFRNGRWQLGWFLEAIRLGVEWAIAERATYDLLAHPSCLYVVDPQFRTIDLICDLVHKAGDKAALVGLGPLAPARQGMICQPNFRLLRVLLVLLAQGQRQVWRGQGSGRVAANMAG